MTFFFIIYSLILSNDKIDVRIVENRDCVITLNMRGMEGGDIYFRDCWLDLLHDFGESMRECFD